MTSLQLDIRYDQLEEHYDRMYAMGSDPLAFEVFTPAMFKVAKQMSQLKVLRLNFSIDAFLFFRQITTEDGDQAFTSPYWPQLVEVSITTPFESAGDTGHSELFAMLLEDIRLSLHHMPQIEILNVILQSLSFDLESIHLQRYITPSFRRNLFEFWGLRFPEYYTPIARIMLSEPGMPSHAAEKWSDTIYEQWHRELLGFRTNREDGGERVVRPFVDEEDIYEHDISSAVVDE